MNEDTKFVRGLFLVISWFMFVGPVVFTIATNQWAALGLIFCSVFGAIIYTGIKRK